MTADPAGAEAGIRVVTTETEWSRLEPEWDVLLGTVDGAAALQSYGFLRCWWRHFGHGKQLRVVVAEKDGKPVGIAPLQLSQRKMYRMLYPVLEFIGMPDELDRPRLLVAEGDDETLDRLLGAIAGLGHDWKALQLDELDADGWQERRLIAWAKRQRLWSEATPLHPVPFLVKAGDWDHYLDNKSRRFRKRLRYARRRLERDHALSYRSSHGPGLHRELLDEFFEIEAGSWKAAKGFDVGSEEGYRDFYRDLLGHDSDTLRGHIVVQYCDGQPCAATLGFSSRGTYYSLQIAHDPRFDKYSPGTLLEAYEMKWFFANASLTRYELLGGEGTNKRRWASDATDTNVVLIRKPNLHFAAVNVY